MLEQHLITIHSFHSLEPGDKVLVKIWKEEPLQPMWGGPYILTTFTTLKVSVFALWVHHSSAKWWIKTESTPSGDQVPLVALGQLCAASSYSSLSLYPSSWSQQTGVKNNLEFVSLNHGQCFCVFRIFYQAEMNRTTRIKMTELNSYLLCMLLWRVLNWCHNHNRMSIFLL